MNDWTAGSLDDGKIYTTGITGTSNGTYGERKTWISRIEYLKQCVRVASQVIYTVDEDAQIGLIGFNAKITDYGTFGKSEQQTLLNKIDNISLAGGTDHQGGLQKAYDKFTNRNYYKEHYAGRKHVVVLVTDGAPNATNVNWTTIGNVVNKLKGLKDDFGHNTELYTMGLSLSNVGTNQNNLFKISSGSGYTYAAEDAAQIINAVTKMVDSISVQAHLIGDVTDVIDPAFYPVNKADGLPLAENDWISLNQETADGEKDLAESPHATSVTGDAVEKYTLTVSYRPAGANISSWHTGSYGSGMAGNRAGNMVSDNTHLINVFAKDLQITKVDLNDRVLTGAKFALYRSARDGETDLLEIDGRQYFKVAELDTSATGIAVKEQIEKLPAGEQYYLVETQAPAGYNGIAPVPVNLLLTDEYTVKPEMTAQTEKPETGIYDWTQIASLVLDAESGIRRTDAENTMDLPHSLAAANADNEIAYYRIINNPGYELPATGGPGTLLFTIFGSILIFTAGLLMIRRQRLILAK